MTAQEKTLTLQVIERIEDKEKIEKIIDDIHPVDFLELLENYEGEIAPIIQKLPDYYIITLIDEAEIEGKIEIFTSLSKNRIPAVVDGISSDELVDMLQHDDFDNDEIKEVISVLDPQEQQEIKELLTYGEETAGGIMATEFIAAKENMTMDETIAYLRKMAPDHETPYYIYVLDEKEHLTGVIQLRQLLTSPPDTVLSDEMARKVISVNVNTDQEEVARLFKKYGFAAMPVLDENDVMVGIVTFDDILFVITEEHTEDMYRLAGMDGEEDADGSVIDSVKSRIVWLIINLFTAILASSVIARFEITISQVVALATLMPIVSGMGGNAGSQTLTLIIRGIATGEIDLKNIPKILLKEISTSSINGLIVGFLLCLITYIRYQNICLGLVIMAALALNLIISAIAGTLVPSILKKLGIDPALASAVFVTAMTDIFGFGIFLALASVFMDYLI